MRLRRMSAGGSLQWGEYQCVTKQYVLYRLYRFAIAWQTVRCRNPYIPAATFSIFMLIIRFLYLNVYACFLRLKCIVIDYQTIAAEGGRYGRSRSICFCRQDWKTQNTPNFTCWAIIPVWWSEGYKRKSLQKAFLKGFERCGRDSNPRPQAWQACILTSWTTAPVLSKATVFLNCGCKDTYFFSTSKFLLSFFMFFWKIVFGNMFEYRWWYEMQIFVYLSLRSYIRSGLGIA